MSVVDPTTGVPIRFARVLPSRLVAFGLAFGLMTACTGAQDLNISPSKITLSMAEGGPLPPVAKISVTAIGAWKVTVSDGDMLAANPREGMGNAVISVGPNDWWANSRKPGNYTGVVTISPAGGSARTIPFAMTIAAHQNAKITYPAGQPTGCADVPNLPAGNAAVCTVPDDVPGAFKPPGLGGMYTDPNFGGRVHIISSPPSWTGYSSPSPVSAGQKYALINVNDQARVVELLTGKVVKSTSFSAEGALWDPQNESILYRLDGSSLRRYDVSSGRESTVMDFSKAPFRFRGITLGGTGEISKDGWLAFHSPDSGQVCAFDIGSLKAYCAPVPAGAMVDYPTMSKGVDRASGQRYLVLVLTGGPFALYAVDQPAGKLNLVTRGPENPLMSGGNRDGICDRGESCFSGSHSDTFEDSEGRQFLLAGIEGQSPCEFGMATLLLSKGAQMGLALEAGGGLKRVFPMFRCGGQDAWVDYHAGCAKASPYCVISTTVQGFGRVREATDTSALHRTPYIGEIMVMRDNGAEMRRLAEHRSIGFRSEASNGYWSTPRAAISPDGAYVVATSNFGFPNQQRVIVVETGFGH